MKKTLLVMIGLSFLAFESIAQKGQGRGRGQGQDIDKNRGKQTTINHQPNRNNRNRSTYVVPRKRGREQVAYRGNTRVIVTHRPGIRYTRPVVIRPYVRYNRGYNYNQVLRTSQVNSIAESMSYARFDDSALQIAKDRIRRNGIRSEDVAYLMQQLYFEDNKLALAKFAWSRTVDRRNFNLVYSELKFRSSQRELDRFIN